MGLTAKGETGPIVTSHGDTLGQRATLDGAPRLQLIDATAALLGSRPTSTIPTTSLLCNDGDASQAMRRARRCKLLLTYSRIRGVRG